MARITEEAPNLGLRTLQPCDILYGWDIETPAGIARWKRTIREKKPLFVIVGWRCTEWCVRNETINYRGERRKILEQRRRDYQPLLDLALWTALEQVMNGRFILYENPPTSQIHRTPEFCRIAGLPGMLSACGAMCAHGAV